LTERATDSRTFWPVAISPVSETMRTCDCDTNCAPAASPRPQMTLTTPAEGPPRCIQQALSVDNGACSDGFKTMVFSSRDGGTDLPGRHEEWVIPRRNRRHDTDGVSPNHARMAGEIFARSRTGEAAAGALRRNENRSATMGSSSPYHGSIRFPAVERLESRQIFAACLDPVRPTVSSKAALSRGVVRFHWVNALPAALTAHRIWSDRRLTDAANRVPGRGVNDVLATP